MKKILAIITIILIIVLVSGKEEEVLIPKEAIRFRVIANSDESLDQELKYIVKDKIQNQMTNDLKDAKDVESARLTIKKHIPEYEETLKETLATENKNLNYEINYGINYFPNKNYKGVTYSEGYYESLVVTLGAGNGNNWWCVLFPPLCLLEAEESDQEEVEYKFFIKELIDKYF